MKLFSKTRNLMIFFLFYSKHSIFKQLPFSTFTKSRFMLKFNSGIFFFKFKTVEFLWVIVFVNFTVKRQLLHLQLIYFVHYCLL